MSLLSSTRSVVAAALACYALSYACVLALAAAKGSEVLDVYSLLVWMVSALIVFVSSGMLAGIVFACLSFRRSRLQVVFVVWASLIAALGLGLVLNAT
jgi:hypothetical protein